MPFSLLQRNGIPRSAGMHTLHANAGNLFVGSFDAAGFAESIGQFPAAFFFPMNKSWALYKKSLYFFSSYLTPEGLSRFGRGYMRQFERAFVKRQIDSSIADKEYELYQKQSRTGLQICSDLQIIINKKTDCRDGNPAVCSLFTYCIKYIIYRNFLIIFRCHKNKITHFEK
ncbi:MAG: hypothetical protein ACOYKJ_07740 [Candidatus Howiella sp.]